MPPSTHAPGRAGLPFAMALNVILLGAGPAEERVLSRLFNVCTTTHVPSCVPFSVSSCLHVLLSRPFLTRCFIVEYLAQVRKSYSASIHAIVCVPNMSQVDTRNYPEYITHQSHPNRAH
jgi:hypothetical protein